jgi:hypothetical protein
MTLGRREVEPLLQRGGINVQYIEGGKPRTARKVLAELVQSFKGEVSICDPYYGLRTLDALDAIPKSCTVHFLTAQTSENSAKLTGPISDFKRERPKVELRLFPNPKDLHDRYILSSQTLLILGQGIKDIGNKESFVIAVSADYAPDLIATMRDTFDNRWKVATPL